MTEKSVKIVAVRKFIFMSVGSERRSETYPSRRVDFEEGWKRSDNCCADRGYCAPGSCRGKRPSNDIGPSSMLSRCSYPQPDRQVEREVPERRADHDVSPSRPLLAQTSHQLFKPLSGCPESSLFGLRGSRSLALQKNPSGLIGFIAKIQMEHSKRDVCPASGRG